MHIAHLHICTFAHLHICTLLKLMHNCTLVDKKKFVKFYKICKKVCKNLQGLQICSQNFWQTLNFSRIFQEVAADFFKNSAAWWSLLVVENFQIHDWKFSDFSHFWEKKLLKFFDFKLSIMWGPFMQNNISWRPQNKWGPPGLARWRWDLVHFREFFRIFGKFLATFLGAKRPGRHKLATSEEQDRSHRVRCFEKKSDRPLGEC